MNKIFIIISLFYSLNVKAQHKSKVDSVYYLLDTLKMPINDRMWEIGIEGKFKYFTILCPCLEYGSQPTFSYRMDIDTGQVITSTVKNSIKLISLPNLILKCKEFFNTRSTSNYAFFLIKRKNNFFIQHRIYLTPPKKLEKLVDYIIVPQDSLKKKNLHHN